MWKPEDWSFVWDRDHPEHPWCMDVRHVRFLYQAIMECRFKQILEVGCYQGYSTSALIQAAKDGCDCRLTLCDVEIRDELKHVCHALPDYRERVRLVSGESIRAIDDHYDLVILDGNHQIENTSRELGLLLWHQTCTVVCHDVAWYDSWCTGTTFLARVLRDHPLYLHRYDARRRPGEFTDRGFLLATRSHEVFTRTARAWGEMLDHPEQLPVP